MASLLLVGCSSDTETERVQRADRFFGMLMGSAVADALAGPHEGRSTEDSQAFLNEGGWINTFDRPYSRWYQSHWNVYEQGAYPGTYTDDSRLRLFVAECMVTYKGAQPFTAEFLADQIFDRYRNARTQFMDANKDVLKERFLEMWFWWELTKLATSVTIPQPPLSSPPGRRENLKDEQGERTGYWKIVDRDAAPVIENLKLDWHDGSYKAGKEWPMGLITCLPLAAYFPGQPELAFQYVLDIDFLDIGIAPLYPALMAAILTLGLGGADWDTVMDRLVLDGVTEFVGHQDERDIQLLESQVVEALKLSDQFRKRDDYPSRANYIEFVSALQSTFGVGSGYDMCTCMEMLAVPLAIADYSMDIGLQAAVENGVNYGRDNDTVASLVATLVGAFRGIDDLNPDWIDLVKSRNPSVDVAELSEKLSRLSRSIP